MVLLLMDYDMHDVRCFTHVTTRAAAQLLARKLQGTSAEQRKIMPEFSPTGWPDPQWWNELADACAPLVMRDDVQVAAIAWAEQ